MTSRDRNVYYFTVCVVFTASLFVFAVVSTIMREGNQTRQAIHKLSEPAIVEKIEDAAQKSSESADRIKREGNSVVKEVISEAKSLIAEIKGTLESQSDEASNPAKLFGCERQSKLD